MAASDLVNLSGLMDDAKCFAFVRQRRWPEGVRCPACSNDAVICDGHDDTQPCRQRYRCKACSGRFDDLTGTMLAGHHQSLRVWVLCLPFMGLNLPNRQIAGELGLDASDVQAMTEQLRHGLVAKELYPNLGDDGLRRALPDGVFQVVQGCAETGRLLARHPGIRKVPLTGEAGTGRAVMADAAPTLKPVTVELGGKSPLIVFDDARLDNAVSGALLGNFYSAGEVCSNGTRVFVHRRVRRAFLDKLLARVACIRVGDPLDPATQVGALISEAHMARVLGYIERGAQEGAELLAGGHRVTDGALARGAFVAPTVFGGCRDGMAIVREEVFGPVMSVLVFDDEDEVVTRANATRFGWAAGVFTSDLLRAHRVIARLQAGTCWVNGCNVTPAGLPFGGMQQSGLGRENGRAAIEHYTQLKSVYVALADIEAPY